MQKRRVHIGDRAREIKKKRKSRTRRTVVLVLVGVLFVIGGIVYLQNIPKFQITKIEVQGTHVISPIEVEETVRDTLVGKYAHLVPKTNALIYPKKKVAEVVTLKYPRAESMTVTHSAWDTLTISIVERESVYLWCGDSVTSETVNGKNCYFADDRGFLFSKAPYFSGIVYLKMFGGLSGDGNEIVGKHILDRETFDKMLKFVESVKTLDVIPHGLVFYPNGERALLLSTELSEDKQKIIFTGDATDTVLENLTAALAGDPLKKDFKEKFDSLRYIDLRYPNKVYYKFQD